MSVPTHNLYDFIHQVTEKQYLLKYFYPWGSKNLKDVIDLIDVEEYRNFYRYKFHQSLLDNVHIGSLLPVLLCHDQEPLHFDLYKDELIDESLIDKWKNNGALFFENFNLRNVHPGNYRQFWILLHSELNSPEIERYENTGRFVGAYWWSHAIIAKDWYRYAEHDQKLMQKKSTHLFLVYCRDTTGSRQYRKDFLNLCKKAQLTDFCNFGNSNNSNNSALYDWKDIVSTDIYIILETIFDQRIHLTEKTLRPIACGQPFILANGPGSLEYLKSYGFKTFDPWINESYDKEISNEKRLNAIAIEMKRLSQLSKHELKNIIFECNKIAEHNKQVFFSEEFFNQIVNELHKNVKYAKSIENDNFDWKIIWQYHNDKKLRNNRDKRWLNRRPYILHFIKHLKKGGTLDDFVPPDLD